MARTTSARLAAQEIKLQMLEAALGRLNAHFAEHSEAVIEMLGKVRDAGLATSAVLHSLSERQDAMAQWISTQQQPHKRRRRK